MRQLERDTAAMTGDNPYTGVNGEKITNYQAGALEQRVLHMQTADTLRTPTYTLFPKPDYFFGDDRARTSAINPAFAWNHGYYSPNIDITWAGFVGPGVARRRHRRAGTRPAATSRTTRTRRTRCPRPAAWAPGSRRPICARRCCTSRGSPTTTRPTARVISQVLRSQSSALRDTEDLAAAYQQINSSVGAFATDTLIADSAALAGGSPSDDSAYQHEQQQLLALANARDALAGVIKVQLSRAAAGHPLSHKAAAIEVLLARALLAQAHHLATAARPSWLTSNGSGRWPPRRRLPARSYPRVGPAALRSRRSARRGRPIAQRSLRRRVLWVNPGRVKQ